MTDPTEREAIERERILELFDARCPGIVGNPYVPHWPHPKQAQFLGAHLTRSDGDQRPFECLFGGAAGGGKSAALLCAAAQYVHHPHYSAAILRLTVEALRKPGGLLDCAIRCWVPMGVRYSDDQRAFTFPSGARIVFGYHASPRDDAHWQGSNYHFVGFEELTQWATDQPYEWLKSRIRRGAGDPIPMRLLSTSNPGGAGHDWVKMRFVGGVDPATGVLVKPKHLYIPSTIDDNPSLDREAYRETLRDMHPTRRAQLEQGNWDARDPGDYFRSEWFGPLLDPDKDALPRGESVAIRWWDLAASENVEAARTAGVLMARLRAGVRAVVHAKAFRATPGKRDDLIAQQAHADGRHVVVGLEIEGGSGGPAQFEALAKRLGGEGFRVVGARPRVGKPDLTDREKATMIRQPTSELGKQGRADPVASCLERGYQRRGECNDTGGPWWGVDAGKPFAEQGDGLRLYSGTWTRDYLDELEGFPAAPRCDLVDATSGAWAWLEAHPFGLRTPSMTEKKPPPAELAHIHPEDRPEREPGRWKP